MQTQPSTRYRQTAVDLEASGSSSTTNVERASMLDRLSYIRDKSLERQWGFIALLGSLFGVVVLGMGLLHMAVEYDTEYQTPEGLCGEQRDDETEQSWDERCAGFPEHLWLAWVYMTDPGTHADAKGYVDRTVSAFIAILGTLFFASVLGYIVDQVRELMYTLNKGKSKVVESGHTLILGWTDRCPALIQEIALACESEGGGVVCILAGQDRQDLENEVKVNLNKKDLRGLRVVIRNGSSMVMKDLECVSACTARNIIILAPTGIEADKADSVVLRTVLQLKGLRHELSGHIVAELRDVDNENLVQMVGMGSVETVVSHDIVGRLMLMAVRQPGLARVYDHILGFEGDEFYLKDWPELHNVKFKDLPLRFPHAVALGIKLKNSDLVELNPDGETTLQSGDELLVLAADDDSYAPCEPAPASDLGTVPKDQLETPEAERILMCGWRRDVDDIIKELDNMVVTGSQLHMLCEVPVTERDGLLEKGGLHIGSLRNISLVHHLGNPAVRRQVEELPLEEYDSILILADEAREADMMHSDSHTLASLLLIRDIQNRRINPVLYERKEFLRRKSLEEAHAAGNSVRRLPRHMQAASRRASTSSSAIRSIPVDPEEVQGCLSVCEVLDHRTRHTIESSRALNQASDFVQSNEFVSRVLAMVAEKREVKTVLDTLLGSTGSSLCVNSPVRYAHENERLSFYSMSLRVQGYREILCGYKKHGQPPELNPKNKEELMLWDDVELIVLSDQYANNMDTSNAAEQTGKKVDANTSAGADRNIAKVAERVTAQLSGLTQQTKKQVIESAIELLGVQS